jgi:hypothetical protein
MPGVLAGVIPGPADGDSRCPVLGFPLGWACRALR